MLCSRYTLRYSFLMSDNCIFFTRVTVRELEGVDKFSWNVFIDLWTFCEVVRLSAMSISIFSLMSSREKTEKREAISAKKTQSASHATFVFVVELLLVYQVLHRLNVQSYQFDFVSDCRELKRKRKRKSCESMQMKRRRHRVMRNWLALAEAVTEQMNSNYRKLRFVHWRVSRRRRCIHEQ